jgi:acetyl esterase/lipase
MDNPFAAEEAGRAELDAVCLECLNTCQTLSSYSKRMFLPEDVRDLALTLAVLERKIYDYVDADLIDRKTPHLTPRGRNITLQDALLRADASTAIQPSLIRGGVASLLFNLQAVLRDTNECLQKLGNRVSKADTSLAVALMWVTVMVYSYGPFRVKIRPIASMLKNALGAIVASALDGPLKGNQVGQVALEGAGKLSDAMSASLRLWKVMPHQLRLIPAAVVSIGALRAIMRWIRLARVRAYHKQLLLLLRLWEIVMDTVAHERRNRTTSYAQLIAKPEEVDYSDALKSASRQLMEGVPLPRALPVYQRGFHSLLRWAVDLAFSTFGFGWNFSGGRSLLAMPLIFAAIPYYMMQPQLSATHAAGVRASMSPGLAKLGCTLLSDNPVTRWCLMQCLPRMAINEHFSLRSPNLWLGPAHSCNEQSTTIPAVPITLFCCDRSVRGQVCIVQDPTDTTSATNEAACNSDIETVGAGGGASEEKSSPAPLPSSSPEQVVGPKVILYCHGGGFFANLLSMDLRLVGQIAWATQALIVVPEYVLAPEHPFPTALDQMEAVYVWIVKGGLGFKPEQVVLVGESAGGNLLAALCLRLLVSNERTASVRRRRAAPAPTGQDSGDARSASTPTPRLAPPAASTASTCADGNGPLPMPQGLCLAYPTLNLAFSSSPSRALCLSDPLLGWGVMRMAVKAYLGGRKLCLHARPDRIRDILLLHI